MDYHKRLVYGKLVDKTLSDIDYSELSELVYGQQYSSDVARRMMYGSRRTLELLDNAIMNNEQNNSITSNIQSKIEEFRKESQKFYDQRREYNKLLSESGRVEHLCNTLKSSADRLNESIGLIEFGENNNYSKNEAILVFSDWHYGMTASNVFNEYNTKICRQRIENVVRYAKQRIKMNMCKRLHIVVLGDIVNGGIHVTSRVASEELICEQLMQVSEILAQAICELHSCVNETIVHMTYGNHARVIPNKKDNIHSDNFERLVPWWLEQRLSQCNGITIENDEENEYHEFIYMDVCGHGFCCSHGDIDFVRNSPRLLSTLFQKRYGKDIEYILLGDKHHIETFNELGITSMICGSLCGTDEYANNKRLYSEPSQLLLIVNDECGVDAEYKIKC